MSLLQSYFDLLNGGHISGEWISKLRREYGNRICITKFELREASPELKDFAYKYDLVIDTLDAYGITEPYEVFKYSFKRLERHLLTSSEAFERLEVTNEGKLNDDDWEDFKERLDLSSTEIIYEQSLITLLTIFEGYINYILGWILLKDEKSRQNARVNIALGEILEKDFSNLDEIVDFLVAKNIEQITGWKKRMDNINDGPINIKIRDKPEFKLVNDAIFKRNILIHNKGKANKKFLKEIKNNTLSNSKINNDYSVDDKVIIDGNYYYQVEKATEDLVKYIDDKVKEKYN